MSQELRHINADLVRVADQDPTNLNNESVGLGEALIYTGSGDICV